MNGSLGSWTSATAAIRNPVIRQPQWWLVNARRQRVGRLATQISFLLQGKYKPIYNPAVDCGDYVVVVNASEIEFTGRKWDRKYYRWHSGYPGGLKEVKAKDMWDRHPERILEHAVFGMLPKNNLNRHRKSRLRIFMGPDHTHTAQSPKEYRIFNTKQPDSGVAWGVIPEYKVEFRKVDEGTENERWILDTYRPKITLEDAIRLKEAKKKGLFGKGNKSTPPEGYIRYGEFGNIRKNRY